MCLTLVQGHQTCLMGPVEYHVCPRAQNTAGTSQHLQHNHKIHNFVTLKQSSLLRINERRTLARLLPCAQAVSCGAHAGPGGRGGGETQLGTVSIVFTAEIGAWEHKSMQRIHITKLKRSHGDVNRCGLDKQAKHSNQNIR